jgi:CRP-like cAMP-binding protein
MQDIRKLFETFTKLEDDDWEVFSSKLSKVHFPKKSIILKKGQAEKYLSFIESGIVRFYIPKTDSDLAFGFVFQNEFISAYDSFLSQTPSQYQVESLSETTLWRLTYQDLQEVYETTRVGNVIGRKNAENLFLLKSKRELSLLNESAEERYLNLFSERPNIIKQIPLKYIASYIGVTPQALSRIRRRIT